jgi:hypothetical protein
LGHLVSHFWAFAIWPSTTTFTHFSPFIHLSANLAHHLLLQTSV